MALACQRLVASVTASIVLLTSINCTCRGQIICAGASPIETKPPASAHHQHCSLPHGHCAPEPAESSRCGHGNSNPTPPICHHCQTLMVSEAPTLTNLLHPLCLTSFIAEMGGCATQAISTLQPWALHLLSDLPPPSHSSTLLNLHCALTT